MLGVSNKVNGIEHWTMEKGKCQMAITIVTFDFCIKIALDTKDRFLSEDIKQNSKIDDCVMIIVSNEKKKKK